CLFFQAEDGIRDFHVTGVQTCALPILGEQSFVVGDVIEVGSRTGIVLSIDMLSVKLRTFDNKLVRIPNETLIKSEVLTITRFPRSEERRVGQGRTVRCTVCARQSKMV